MAAPVIPDGPHRGAHRELTHAAADRGDRPPLDACLVLVDRIGDLDLVSAARGAAEGSDLSLRVLTVTAASAARGLAWRYPPGELRFGAGAWWSTILRDVLAEIEEEIFVFLEISALSAFNGAVALASELAGANAAAIAARVLDPRGVTIAFDRGTFDVIAHRDTEHRGFVSTSVPMAQRPSLFFDGRAFAARRSALLDVGPPHPDIGDVFADVDWSWRLWLAGHRVLTSDRTAVLEKDTGTHAAERLPASMRRAREQRAAHRILAEVLEPDNLTRAFALSSAIEAADAGEDTDGLLGTDPRGLTRPTRGQAREALVRPAALHAVGAGGDELAAERATIQAARVVSDEELFAEVGTVFRAYADTPEGTALRRLLLPRVQRVRPAVLILCSDDLGELMAGPAIRAVELARALMPGVDPIIAAHRVDPRVELPCPAVALSTDVLKGLLDDADAVVLQGPVTDWFPQVLRSGVPLAIDLYDPMHLEALQRAGAVTEMPHVLNLVVDQLRRGDFFFCASERQRDYWLGMLSSLGRVTADAYAEDPDLRGLIDVVPFGIPSEPPTRVASGPRETVDGIGVDDVLLVWNGGLWDWFDPETFLRALAAVREELPMLRAYFMGVRRPGSTELAPAARRVMALSDELGLTGSTVFFNDWTPYDTRQDVYLDASAIVSLHHAHLESRFSFRTRLLDALWGRVPIICTRGDVVAGIVEELQLGVTVPPGDVEAVVQALRDFATDPALLDRTRAQLEIAAPAYEWAHAVAPLARWLAAPGRRTDPAVLVGGPRAASPRQARREAFERYMAELKLVVPTPLRQHVLGPARRRLQAAARALRGAR